MKDHVDRSFGNRLASVLRAAPPLALPYQLVESQIDSKREAARLAESQFRLAFQTSLSMVPASERGGLNGVTGHIAESVVESMLANAGWIPVEHFVGPFSGGHGIDLAMLSPSLDSLFVVEVKGTLQRYRWPRLSRGEVDQMSHEWLDGPDNPGMRSIGLDGDDVGAFVFLIQFAKSQWKGVFSHDLQHVEAVSSTDQLEHLSR